MYPVALLARHPGFRSLYRRLKPVKVACRAATLADAPKVAELMEPLFPRAAREEALPAAERLLSETLRAGGEYRIAAAGGRIAGGCQVGPLLQSAGLEGTWILGLWVHPRFRGRGVGQTLMEDLIRTARKRREERLYCHISSSNRASLSLFLKLGFQDAPQEIRERAREKFGAAFGGGSELRVFRLDLRG